MQQIWGRLPVNLRERPFDAYISVLLFWIGLYQLVDPTWPEQYTDSVSQLVIVIISLYLICAGMIIFLALMNDAGRYPIFCFFGQMYGWSFMSAATAAVTLICVWNALAQPINNIYMLIIWTSAWFFMTVASILRSVYMWRQYRRLP